jgi:rare lipoprotein A
VGEASSYDFEDQKTASGDTMDPGALTTAHRSLPFGTKLKVKHVEAGKTVVVRINDGGPFAGGRILDLSKPTAKKRGILKDGAAKVRMTEATQAN